MVDLHCHILPGLDDGAATLEESLAMAGQAVQDGVETIVATPHLFRSDCASDNSAAIESKREELRRALRENHIELEILGGSEVHISHHLIPEIKADKDRLVINRGSYMFVEFPANHVFPGAKSFFFELLSLGIRPIIAHPERNSVFMKNPLILYDLIQMGATAQANSGSFFGRYGTSSLAAVERFLELGLVHFIASDGHDRRAFSPGLSEASRRAGLIIGDTYAGALVRDNPRAVLKDDELPYRPVSAGPARRSFSFKIPSFFRRKGRHHPSGLDR